MIRVTALVEGYGDVGAFPILLARAGEMYGHVVVANNPIRCGEWTALKAKGAIHKFLQLAYSRKEDLILVALDLDDGCPVEEARIANDAIMLWKNGRDIAVEVVFFSREYETMFLWCSETLGEAISRNPEDIRDAKGAMRAMIGRRYKETQDQVALTRAIPLRALFPLSRPFRRLCHALFGDGYMTIPDAARPI